MDCDRSSLVRETVLSHVVCALDCVARTLRLETVTAYGGGRGGCIPSHAADTSLALPPAAVAVDDMQMAGPLDSWRECGVSSDCSCAAKCAATPSCFLS